MLKLAGVGAGQTVGDFMHNWSSDIFSDGSVRRTAFDRINAAGLDVKEPSSRIPWIIGGGVVGREAAKYLGANRFWRNAATVVGAMYGNSMYNDRHPDPMKQKIAPGMVRLGW